jgi:peptidoglycan/LPS O-acetylase OafA/YrhL
LISIHIFSISHIFRNREFFNKKFELLIRHLSSVSFSIYLYHMPILFFISALFPHQHHPILNSIGCLIITPLATYIIGIWTEKKKTSYKLVIAKYLFKK